MSKHLKTILQSRRQTILWCATIIWALCILGMGLLSGLQTQRFVKGIAHGFERLWTVFFDLELSALWQSRLPWLVMIGVQLAAYAVLAILLYTLLVSRRSQWRALITSAVVSAVFAGVCEFYPLIMKRTASLSHWLLSCAGMLAALVLLLLIRWLWKRYPRILNRETVTYVFFGVLTTIVNMAVYGVSYNEFGIHNLLSNAIAWMAAVLFAYAVNKWFVFQSRNVNAREAWREFVLFIGARLFSFGVDELCMWLLVDGLHVNSGVSKIAVNVIVMVMNFFFSKWFIFRESNTSKIL